MNTGNRLTPLHPWPGLEPFQEGDAGFFFGRGREIADLRRRVERNDLTVLFAQSGLGKTSLLHAGLFPALRKSWLLPIYVRLEYGAHAASPLTQVWSALESLIDLESPYLTKQDGSRPTLWEWVHDTQNGLRSEALRGAVPVLVFDQFEEIFTLGARSLAKDSEQDRFLNELADVVENRAPKELVERLERGEASLEQFEFEGSSCRVLISLREDYLSMLERERGRMPSLMRNRMPLDRLRGEQAIEAVMQPAPHLVDRSVAGRIVRFVSGTPEEAPLAELEVEPSLLSLVCRELNRDRLASDPSPPSITTTQLSGKREAILEKYYLDCFAGLEPDVRIYVENELLTDSNFRDSKAMESAAQKAGLEAVTHLVDARLLHTEKRSGLQRIEITHDVLVPIVARSRDQRRERERIEQAELEREEARHRELQARRERARAYQLAALMLLLAAVAVWQWWEATHARRAAEAAQNRAVESQFIAEAREREAKEARRLEAEARRIADEQRGKAVVAQGEAERARGVSETARAQAEDLINFMLFDLRDKLEPLNRIGLLDDVTRKAEAYFKAQPSEGETDAQRRNRGAMFQNRGSIDLAMGRIEQALVAFQEFFRIMSERAGLSPESLPHQRDLAIAHDRLGLAYEQLGRWDEAIQSYTQEFNLINGIASAQPENADFQRHLADSHQRLGDVLIHSGNQSAALKHHEECHRVFSQLHELEPMKPDNKRGLAVACEKLADAFHGSRRTVEALPLYGREVEILQELVDGDKADSRLRRALSVALQKKGVASLASGKKKIALELLSRSLEIAEALAAADPLNQKLQQDLAYAHDKLASALKQAGMPAQALIHWAKDLELCQALASVDPANATYQRELAVSHWNVGLVRLGEGTKESITAARTHYQNGLEILRRLESANKLDATGRSWLPTFEQALQELDKLPL